MSEIFESPLLGLILIGLLFGVTSWIFFFGVPLLARARFVATVGRVRDDLADALLDGRLPADDVAIVEFCRVANDASENPWKYGLTEAYAAHETLARTSVETSWPPSYNELSPIQRKEMHGHEKDLLGALKGYLFWGSRIWYLVIPFQVLVRLLHQASAEAGGGAKRSAAAPGSETLAREVRVVRGKGLRGPTTSARSVVVAG
jgi:hypothetical protein